MTSAQWGKIIFRKVPATGHYLLEKSARHGAIFIIEKCPKWGKKVNVCYNMGEDRNLPNPDGGGKGG
jgi:hypothetical protein